MHEPGACTGDTAPSTGTNRARQPQANVSEREGQGNGGGTRQKSTKLSKKRFKALLTEKLGESNAFNDDLTGLISAIADAAYE